MRTLALIVVLTLVAAPAAHARERAPGAPGKKADWAPGNKLGFGTASATTSRIWFTLSAAGMDEAFYPDLQHPSARSLGFMVDGQNVTSGTVANAALTYTQTSELAKHWRLTRTYVTDPERDAILVKVHFESLDGSDHDVELAFDPALYGDGDDDVGWTHGHALLAHDRHIASALEARPALTRTSSGYKGHDDALLEHTYDALRPGNVVQQAHTRLTGRADHQDLTLALAFGAVASEALKTASAALDAGFDATAAAYADGWRGYRNTLYPIPATALPVAGEYETSLYLLKAGEDKDHPGLFIASPSSPWGRDDYHRARPRDSYEIATALLAAGDKDAANRVLDHLLDDNDENPLTVVLAYQLNRTSKQIKTIADTITHPSRAPDVLAAQIAALVCAGELKRADRWQRNVDRWTTNDGLYTHGMAFLELVRLGVKRADDPVVLKTLEHADQALKAGAFYHRFPGDSYGETAKGRPFDDGAHRSFGRAWPLLSGQRGEYELLAGRPASDQITQLAGTANGGGMLPEQVWDGRAPTAHKLGTPTTGATPFLWAHAQLIRLAWDAAEGKVQDRPKVVANRYANAAS